MDSLTKNIFILTGDPSADLYGANLISAILKKNNQVKIYAWGGNAMKQAGATILKDYSQLAFMGFVEVLKNIFTIRKNFKEIKNQILRYQPHCVILMDYPGFNLRIAQWLFENNITVHYYITPQVWAWKSSRVNQLKKYCTVLHCILPFEEKFFTQHNTKANYVGHPLLEHFNKNPVSPYQHPKPYILLLPGSREQEIKKILPVFLSLCKNFKQFDFIIAQAPNLDKKIIDKYTSGYPVTVIKNETHTLMRGATLALVASGTATLETALLGCPQIVCYKANAWSVALARWLVGNRIKYISLVNLILNKNAVPELIQEECIANEISNHITQILQNTNAQKDIQQELYNTLGQLEPSEIVSEYCLQNI